MEAIPQTRRVQPFAAGRLSSRSRVLLAAIPLSAVSPNPAQPRRRFDEEQLEELAASIRDRGVLQPIIVRRDGGRYLIMAGERRYRAARKAGLESIPAIVRDDDPLEVALIENLQREDLAPLEEAEAMSALIARHGYTHQALAALLHKSRPYVTNSLVLTRLPQEIREEVADGGEVSREVLIAIARQESPEAMRQLWERARLSRLSVRKLRSGGTVQGEGKGTDSLRMALLAARRLNRALRQVGADSGDSSQWRGLKRVLVRTRNAIDRLLINV